METVAGDVRDRPIVDRAVQGVDTVVSMIQGFGGDDALGPRLVDRDGNLVLIDAAAAAGVRHFILLSVDQAAADHPVELFRGGNPINFVAADDVAGFVDLAVADFSMRGSTTVVAGPQDLTFDEFAAIVGNVIGRPGSVDHVPPVMLKLMSAILRPIRPVLAGQMQTALVMDSWDLRSDAGPRQKLAPSIPVTPLVEVVRREFAA